ncbi:MAG: GreA/GreB family elongation factor [Burkholderiales bacterium]|nr:GreA/GreB family elongation factor [Burkholderiales bacterium]
MLGDRARIEDDAAAALAATLAGARIVGVDDLPADVVAIGASVDYADADGRRRTVTLAFPAQADAGAGRVSVLSPVGRALLGRRVGAVATVLLPDGRRLPVRIVDVRQRRAKDAEALALV